MPEKQTVPFRADHVGSLLRSPDQLRARDEARAGRLSADALKHVEDDAVRDVVRMQEALGLPGITDGELRRGSWHMDFLYQFGGVSKIQDTVNIQFHNAQGDIEFKPAALRVTGKLKLERTIFGEEFAFLRSCVTRGTPKLTIPSPSMMTYRGGYTVIDRAVYPDLDGFRHDLARAYADEIAALNRLGCTYLQLDDTSLAYLNDPTQRDYLAKLGGDPDRQHLVNIALVNAAVADKPAGMSICVHMCRGNHRSSWVASGGYDYVADAIFNQLDVDGYFLEYDDARSGSFAALRFVPKGKKRIVLGIVSSKRGELETKDRVRRRIDEAAKYVALDQLCLSPQCGFASTELGNALTLEQQNAKLRLIVELAREIWG
ncbi:MAG TPA: 5-methyltetrahydropteroyltriglutamate--homocysteine S-methyltransferase [Stellaceae bacterium]|nr:5-methyltetrahydropteroyltriglutamate--homocysteine S-methyltransferase [Stellaceae bacterium]